jgi:hypothetical protein
MTLPKVLRAYALALAGNALLLVLGWAWLHIPDAHLWQFLFTAISGIILVTAFLALHVRIIHHLYSAARRPLWKACLYLFAFLALACVLQHFAGLLTTNVSARAGYWNSQMTAHHRAFYTYQRLIDWQNFAIDVLIWIIIPTLVLPFAIEYVPRTYRPLPAAAATLRRPELWLAIIAVYFLGTSLGHHLIEWRPAHSVTGELISVVLRTLLVYAFAVALLIFTLTLVAHLLARQHARRDPIP